jgi:hypothetical protein
VTVSPSTWSTVGGGDDCAAATPVDAVNAIVAPTKTVAALCRTLMPAS